MTEVKLKAKYRVGGRSAYKSSSATSGHTGKKSVMPGGKKPGQQLQRARVMVVHANGKKRMHDAGEY